MGGNYGAAPVVSGIFFAAALAAYLIAYLPRLVRARLDGKDG